MVEKCHGNLTRCKSKTHMSLKIFESERININYSKSNFL